MSGYIYLRFNPSYEPDNVYKIGSCTDLKDRNNFYKDKELFPSTFILVLEILEDDLHKVEYRIRHNFAHLNKRYGSSIDYYDTKILREIEPFLKNLGIKFTKIEDWLQLDRT